jgi:hypothetical protein
LSAATDDSKATIPHGIVAIIATKRYFAAQAVEKERIALKRQKDDFEQQQKDSHAKLSSWQSSLESRQRQMDATEQTLAVKVQDMASLKSHLNSK